MRNPGHEEWWGYSPMILPMYSKVLFGYVLTILHLKLVSQCDRPHVHLMHTPIRTFLCWLVISEMVSLFGRVSQFSKTSTIFVAQIAPQLNHPVPVSPTRSQVGLGQPWKLGLHLKPTLAGHSWKSSGNQPLHLLTPVRCWKKPAVNIKSLLGGVKYVFFWSLEKGGLSDNPNWQSFFAQTSDSANVDFDFRNDVFYWNGQLCGPMLPWEFDLLSTKQWSSACRARAHGDLQHKKDISVRGTWDQGLMSWLQDFELHPGTAEIISSMVDFKIRLFTELVGRHWLSVVVGYSG